MRSFFHLTAFVASLALLSPLSASAQDSSAASSATNATSSAFTGPTVFNCVGGVVAGIAHPDDDLLFQSPDLLATVQGGACYTLVIATMGDDGLSGEGYALSREAGNAAAYAQMAGVDNVWTGVNATIADQQILVTTLVGAPQIQRVLFRLPDGNMDGSG